MEIVLPIVQRIMLDINPVGVFAEICTYACLTMSHMLRRLTNRVQDFVNTNFCRRLTELMQQVPYFIYFPYVVYSYSPS